LLHSNTTQVLYNQDNGNRVDENRQRAAHCSRQPDVVLVYGSHPTYFEARKDQHGRLSSHGVTLFNAHGMEVALRPGSLTYRVLGGTLDFRFVSGSTLLETSEELVKAVGLPALQAYWTLGLHLCRYGYYNISEVEDVVQRMRDAQIPLEAQWFDIDYMDQFRDFSLHPVNFPADRMKSFVADLHERHQKAVFIIDPGLHKPDPTNEKDVYYPYDLGKELGVFVKNADGSEYIGRVRSAS
jgi:alpha-glucosidase